MKTRYATLLSILSLSLFGAACGDDGGDGHNHDHPDSGVDIDADDTPDIDADVQPNEDHYLFESKFTAGESAVSKSGQTYRHLLIANVKSYFSGMTAAVETTPPNAGDISEDLTNFYLFDSGESGILPVGVSTTPEPLQATFDDVSSGKNLFEKMAGQDTSTDHKDWNTAGNFVGWDANGVETPDDLIRHWIAEVDALAVARVNSPQLIPGTTTQVGNTFTTSTGLDYQQLMQKFLLGAIGMSQGMDDYLDDDTEGKGLLASNLQYMDKSYTSLGHAWDEGFGYFGGSIDYGDYTSDERASKGGREDYQGHHDVDGDNKIDLKSEYIFGNAVNCGKRDRGATTATTFGDDAFQAFLDGRKLIHSVDGELSAAQLDELRGFRDTAVQNWEKCVAATVVHYINDVLDDMSNFGTKEYSFEDHAKHWGELKGFALGLQFNPASPMNDGARFSDFHDEVGTAPVLGTASDIEIAEYREALLEARGILATAYGFATDNVENW